MTTLRMEPDKLRNLAAAIHATYTGSHHEALTRHGSLRGALRAAWSAQAQAALDAAFGDWLTGFDRRGRDLIAMARYLRLAAETSEAQEARLEQALPFATGGAGKALHRPSAQGNGPVLNGPVTTAGGSLAARDIPGLAAVTEGVPAVPTLISYRADYSLQTYTDRVELRLTQYTSTNRTVGAAAWWTTATVTTASGRTVTYNLGALNLNPARPDSAFLSIPTDPSDPPVSLDLSVGNAAANAVGAMPITTHYATVPIQVPSSSPTPTTTGPYSPTPTPSSVPGLRGPQPIQIPTPTPTPAVPVGPVLPTPRRPAPPSFPGRPAIPE